MLAYCDHLREGFKFSIISRKTDREREGRWRGGENNDIRASHLFITCLCAPLELKITIGLLYCQVPVVNKSHSNVTPRVLPVVSRESVTPF